MTSIIKNLLRTVFDPAPELRRMQNEYYLEVIRQFSPAIKPILGIGDNGSLVMLGSGILLKLDGRNYLVSAAHVFLQAKDSKIYTSDKLDGKTLIPIIWNGLYSPEDKFDFAVSSLNEDEIQALGENSFIEENQIAILNQSSHNHCMALGYPKTRNRVSISRKEFDGSLYPYITKSIRKEPNFSFFIYEDILHDEKKRIFDKPLDPDGMSGGMLLDLGTLSGWENIVKAAHDKTTKAKLLGLILEKAPIKKNAKNVLEIKAVDIELIREYIRQEKTKNDHTKPSSE